MNTAEKTPFYLGILLIMISMVAHITHYASAEKLFIPLFLGAAFSFNGQMRYIWRLKRRNKELMVLAEPEVTI